MNEHLQALRDLGARAHQARATTAAADRFLATHTAADRDTGVWLVSWAVELAAELTRDIDELARRLRDDSTDTPLLQSVQGLRVRAHQLHASVRAADRLLEQDAGEDQDHGSWLIASAREVAQRLAGGIDDCCGSARRQGAGGTVGTLGAAPALDVQDAALLRRVGQAMPRVHDAA